MIVQRVHSSPYAGPYHRHALRGLSPGALAWWSDVERLSRRWAAWTDDLDSGVDSDARFAALNIGTTPTSVEVYAFAPGIDRATLDVQIDQGVLTLRGERKPAAVVDAKAQRLQNQERFEGPFVRRVALPDDADASRVEARYQDGVLRITVARREAVQPRRVAVS